MSSDRYERNYIEDRLEPQNLSVTEKDVNRDKHKKTEDIEEEKRTLNRALIITPCYSSSSNPDLYNGSDHICQRKQQKSESVWL